MYYDTEEIKEMEEEGDLETPEPEEVNRESLMYDYAGIYIKAPSQSIAMKWLREVYGIVICVSILNENNKGNDDYSNPDRWWYFFDIINAKGVYNEELQPDPLSNEYSTYEEAAEAAIKYCLENLI